MCVCEGRGVVNIQFRSDLLSRVFWGQSATVYIHLANLHDTDVCVMPGCGHLTLMLFGCMRRGCEIDCLGSFFAADLAR